MKFSIFLLRITSSLMMLAGHGIPKLISFESNWNNFPDPLGLGSQLSFLLVLFAEVICSVFLLLGIKVRMFVLPPISIMVVAILVFHANDPFAQKELAIMYLLSFIVILISGGGSYSLRLKKILNKD